MKSTGRVEMTVMLPRGSKHSLGRRPNVSQRETVEHKMLNVTVQKEGSEKTMDFSSADEVIKLDQLLE